MKSTNPKEEGFFSRSWGFTLIELLVVISILLVVLTMGLINYGRVTRRQAFNQGMEDIMEEFRLTQDKALSAEKPVACGTNGLEGYMFQFDPNRVDYSITAECGLLSVIVKTGSLPGGVSKLPQQKKYPENVLFKVLGQGADLHQQDELRHYEELTFGFRGPEGLEGFIGVTETGEIFFTDDACGMESIRCDGERPACCRPLVCQPEGGVSRCRD